MPDLKHKTVLDVGCDHGWWCREAISLGAGRVLGLDRNRKVKGIDVDLVAFNKVLMNGLPADFRRIDLGKQWYEFGKSDVVFCFSMYHHVYQNCGDHDSIWYWLWRHTDEVLLWENPTSTADPVVRMNVTKPYEPDEISQAANKYFEIETIGPALHVATRVVWRCWPRLRNKKTYTATIRAGSGGATKAFDYNNGTRRRNISDILGTEVISGSLNVRTDRDFHWDEDYYRIDVADPVDRNNIDGEWKPRPMRFYPVELPDGKAHALRFEGETYKENFVELIADRQLRSSLTETFTID